jgi:deazaflavin-dependent oxidoreductase (nitroreductase family)
MSVAGNHWGPALGLIDRRPRGLLKAALRAPVLLYRARLGWLAGHRLLYLAHRGRVSGRRRETVVEVVDYDPGVPRAVVIAAWGGEPDWYRNLLAGPALEVRLGRQRWVHPRHEVLAPEAASDLLDRYRQRHPHAWRRIGPALGFPPDPSHEGWRRRVEAVHAVAFRPDR